MWITECQMCSGSGACDPCQGYGVLSDSYPNANDGPECDVCRGNGICPDCAGAGEGIDDSDPDDDTTNYNSNDCAASGGAGWKASA
jgi:hypothetical protein